MAKADGEWKTKVVAEAATGSKSVKWQAVRQKAPDGKVFRGIRKVITKADGTIFFKPSMTLLWDDDGANQLNSIIKLLKQLQG